MGFVLDTKNHHDVRWKVGKGDTFYKIAAELTKKSAQTIDVNGKQSSGIPDLFAIKPKSPETKPYSIIAHQLNRENNIAPGKLQVGLIINVPDQFDFDHGKFSELKSLILQGNEKKASPSSDSTTSTALNRYGNQTLRRGMRSKEILNLQEDLKVLAWFVDASPNGIFGPITKKAVQGFQEKTS
jgi:hypothetical protein